jgi:hypothetical protein
LKTKPNVEQFIAGGKGEETKANEPPLRSKRKAKLFYLSLELWGELKQQAVTESQEKKSRVTETDIVERALEEYITSKKVR